MSSKILRIFKKLGVKTILSVKYLEIVMLKLLTVIVFALFLSSCAPVYKIAHDYSPPTSKRGLVCLSGCQSQLKQCNQSCSAQYKQCAVKAEQQAKKLLPGLLVAYPRQIQLWQNSHREYQRELDWYEFRQDMAESRRDLAIDICVNKGEKRSICYNKYGYDDYLFPRSKPSFSLPRPIMPTLSSESTKIRKANCSHECGCNNKYRLCYASCGGVVKSKKICIKNCGQ